MSVTNKGNVIIAIVMIICYQSTNDEMQELSGIYHGHLISIDRMLSFSC